MHFNRTKKLLKSNPVKFLLAIVVSILAHLFLLGGLDVYNPFFLKDSDSLNIIIVSHLESPLKNDQPVSQKISATSKKSIKKNKEIGNNSIKKEEGKGGDLDQNLEHDDLNQTLNSDEKKEIHYKKVIIDYDVRRGLDGSPIGAAKTTYLIDQDNRYSIRNEVEARGFVSLFYWNKLVQTSNGLVTSEGLKPLNYHYQFGSKIDNSAVFDWESKKIITDRKAHV